MGACDHPTTDSILDYFYEQGGLMLLALVDVLTLIFTRKLHRHLKQLSIPGS